MDSTSETSTNRIVLQSDDDTTSRREERTIECRNTAVTGQLRARLSKERQALAQRSLRGLAMPVMFPIDAYGRLFLMQPDRRIIAMIEAIVRDEERAVARGKRSEATGGTTDFPGFIYCFWNEDDDQAATTRQIVDANGRSTTVTSSKLIIVKLGKTTRKPEQRIAEWESDLSPEPGTSIRLLFAFPTLFTSFAESLVHRTLYCEWLPKRVNIHNGRRLTEFFKIREADLLALRLFVQLVLLYADRKGAEMRQQINK